jgi:hypothetical protein
MLVYVTACEWEARDNIGACGLETSEDENRGGKEDWKIMRFGYPLALCHGGGVAGQSGRGE